MRITEIEWKEGNKYIVDNEVYTVVYNDPKEYELKNDTTKFYITRYYSTSEITKMNFELVIDWSTVAVDTPVWVEYDTGWKPRHFQGFDIAKMHVRVYFNGWTSHSANECVEEHHHSEVSLTKPK